MAWPCRLNGGAILRRDVYLMRGSAEVNEEVKGPLRWKNKIEKALSSIGVTNWRRRTRNKVAWKDMLTQTEIR